MVSNKQSKSNHEIFRTFRKEHERAYNLPVLKSSSRFWKYPGGVNIVGLDFFPYIAGMLWNGVFICTMVQQAGREVNGGWRM